MADEVINARMDVMRARRWPTGDPVKDEAREREARAELARAQARKMQAKADAFTAEAKRLESTR